MVNHSVDAFVCTGSDGVRTYASPSFAQITGYPLEEVTKVNAFEVVHPDDLPMVKDVSNRVRGGLGEEICIYRYIRKDRSIAWVETRLRSFPDPVGSQFAIVANVRDITRRKLLEEGLAATNAELVRLAWSDGLTGLANRRRFDEAAEQECRRARREGTNTSLLLIDVDHFKNYNDHYGHQEGDECLKKVAGVIGGNIKRPADTAARYGGEEFAIVLPSTDEAGAQELAEQIRAAVEALAVTHARSSIAQNVTVSIGFATYSPKQALSGPAPLVALADRALYQAKHTGRNRVVSAAALANCAAQIKSGNEARRLAAVSEYGEPHNKDDSEQLDSIARIAAHLYKTPIGLVTLVGKDTQSFIGRFGTDFEGTPREVALCNHTISGRLPLVVPDTTLDPRFSTNPLVVDGPKVRFYAGAPLFSPSTKQVLGTVCVIDLKSRATLDAAERETFSELANLVVAQLEKRRTAGRAGMDPAV